MNQRPLTLTSLEVRLFEAIFRAEADFVWRVLLTHGVPARDAEDVMQELFVAVLRRIGEYDTARPAKCWLFVFAVRFARAYRAAAPHRRVLLRGDEIARADEIEWAAELDPIDDSPDQERIVAARELCAVALELLERLTLRRRLVLMLHDVEGVPMPELTRQLGIGVEAGYSRLHLARLQFRALYDAYLAHGSIPPRPKRLEAAFAAQLPLDAEVSQLLVSLRPKGTLSPRAKRRVWGSLCVVAGIGGFKPSAAVASPRGTVVSAPKLAMVALSIVACGLIDSIPSFGHPLGHGLLPEAVAAAEAFAEPARAAPAGSADASTVVVAPAPVASTSGFAAHRGPPPSTSLRPAAWSASAPSEWAILVDARHALQRGNPHEALRIVDTHEQRFPQSPVKQERDIIRIEALIQAGNAAMAGAQLAAFRKAYPGSIHLPAFHMATHRGP